MRPDGLALIRIGGRRDHADFGIVLAPVGVAVAEDVGLRSGDGGLLHGVIIPLPRRPASADFHDFVRYGTLTTHDQVINAVGV
jgi:hypothetical protein